MLSDGVDSQKSATNFQFSSKQETVAVIVADSPYAAQDAVDLVRVDYEPLEAVIDGELTTKKGAPLLHEDASQSVELSVGKIHANIS